MRSRHLSFALTALLCLACDGASLLDPAVSPPGPSMDAALAANPGGASTLDLAAHARPFAGRFDGVQSVTVTPPTASVAVSATGTATLLGRFTIELPHTVHLPTSTAQGTATLVAANGDIISATFAGQAVLGPIVHIVEHATITGGTGRFAAATGSFVIERVFDPGAGTTTGSFAGSISIPGGAAN